jgi:hypothetical protein
MASGSVGSAKGTLSRLLKMDRNFQASQWREPPKKTNAVVSYVICKHLLLRGVVQSASAYHCYYSFLKLKLLAKTISKWKCFLKS